MAKKNAKKNIPTPKGEMIEIEKKNNNKTVTSQPQSTSKLQPVLVEEPQSICNVNHQLLLTLVVGLVIRVGFILYGVWQDANMHVKFTDIDYNVFTDAAEFVTKGESPFRRATYRYTPIIAWILTPNITCHILWGKFLFVSLDILGGYLIYKISRGLGHSHSASLLCCQVALFNPLPLAVSSRGNAEAIMAVLTLTTVYCLNIKSWIYLIIAAVVYGISVHVKIYPVIFAPAIYLFLSDNYTGGTARFKIWGLDLLPNSRRMVFITVSISVCLTLTAICYELYGYEFIYETYLYHIVRKDIKHNFSPYFYLLYLLEESDALSKYIGIITFIPQATFVIVFALKLHKDLSYCFCMQTFLFVSFNKVCTSQYFLWYLAFFPLLLPRLHMRLQSGLALIVAWFFGQAAWLLPAYYLEFEGKDTFLFIWLASLLFLAINVIIASSILHSYQYRPLYVNGNRVSVKGRALASINDWLFSTNNKDKKA